MALRQEVFDVAAQVGDAEAIALRSLGGLDLVAFLGELAIQVRIVPDDLGDEADQPHRIKYRPLART